MIEEKVSNRFVNLDLLRIFSMFLIIFLHSIDHSGVLSNVSDNNHWINIYVNSTYFLCQVCVNLYVLISGYFLVKSQFKLKKLIKLWLEVVFYSIIIKILFMITGQIPFSLFSLLSCFVPIISGRYWFITIYFGLYLIFPFLNIAINNMNKEQHMKLNITFMVLFSVLVSIHPNFAGMNSGGGWGLAWFVVLYFAASWIRLYYKPNGKYKLKLLFWLLFSIFVAFLLLKSQIRFSSLYPIIQNWFRYDNIFVYILSIVVFLAFLNIKIYKGKRISKIISIISSCTFGVYLIHAHAETMYWIWDVSCLSKTMKYLYFPIYQIFLIFLVFFVSSLIELIRKKTLEKFENKYVFKCINKVKTKLNGRKYENIGN